MKVKLFVGVCSDKLAEEVNAFIATVDYGGIQMISNENGYITILVEYNDRPNH